MQDCESCGRGGEEVVAVQRVYLVPPEGADGPPAELEAEAAAVAGDIELWCASCRATYPHVEVTGS